MITKQHFEGIAAVIKSNLEDCLDPNERIRVEQIADDLSAYFASENPRFNEKVFLAFCGIDVVD